MMVNDKLVEKKNEIKKFSNEEFVIAYEELCNKMGWRISVRPTWVPRDDGSWSVVLQTTVEKLPEISK